MVGSEQREYGIEIASIAEDLVRGRTNVTIVGDSINNDGQPGFMMSGFLLEWRQVRWRQFHPPVYTNGASIGSWFEFSLIAHHGHLGPADPTGEGRVDDADLGEMFLQWGDTAARESPAREGMTEDRRPVSSLR